jgi:nitroreductase
MNDTPSSDLDRQAALARAADAARFAPSVHNTQPWRWIVYPDRLELLAVTERQLAAQDPDAHLLQLSCGTALHHAQVALDAESWRYRVERPAGVPLAVIHLSDRAPVDPTATRHLQNLEGRHTDRRTVTADPIEPATVTALTQAAEEAGARLQPLDPDQVIELAVLIEHAQKTEDSDERLQAETARWVGGERSDGTGVPAYTLPQELPLTTVAERDFGAPGTLEAGRGHDSGARYAVLYGDGDDPVDWLRAGEALSALWLTATEHGAGVLPLSSPVEVPYVRQQLRQLLGDIGYPYLAVRLGAFDPAHAGPARTPRLPREQTIEIRR